MAATVPALDTSLIAAAREGRIVLFLGAGASLGAKNKNGQAMPDGRRLGLMIVEKFLRPEHTTLDFKTICDFACAESSVRDVQKFIHDVLIAFEPTAAHLDIPKFIWAGIAGTNYDLLVERSYAAPGGLQKIVPYTKNGTGAIDRHDGSQILYAKLHGCITDYEDIETPLVASTEQLIRLGQADQIYTNSSLNGARIRLSFLSVMAWVITIFAPSSIAWWQRVMRGGGTS
jgi:hypothetical protein